MTRKDFLNDLYRHLYGLTQEQAEQHLTYYAEMLADRIEEGMTEDEAVASMEDVETIARRILEEEGLPYTPPEERPPVPPQYPDASRLQGGGGTRGYQVPKKWTARKLIQTALWGIAAIALVSAASHWFLRHGGNTPPVPIPDYATESVAEAAPIDNSSWEYDGYYAEAPYVEGGYEYGGGTDIIGSIEQIDIQWAAGTVYIQSWNSDEVQIMEYAHSELSSRTAMSCQTDGSTLTIRYRDGISLGSVKDDKWLTVLIPDGMVGELKIETTSADVRMNGLETEKLTVSTASGYVRPTECYTQKAELSSISGEMILSELYADKLDVSTTSGDISGDVSGSEIAFSTISGDISLSSWNSVEKINAETTSGDIWFSVGDPSVQSIGVSSTSGDISLSLPYDMGFTLKYDTVSGDLLPYSDFTEMTQQNGKYVYNGGGCEIKAATVSGDLDIY